MTDYQKTIHTLTKFCGTGNLVDRPWIEDSWMYFCSGIACARIVTTEPDYIPLTHGRRPPNARILFSKFQDGGEPFVHAPVVEGHYPECRGSGYAVCDKCEHEEVCSRCKQTGIIIERVVFLNYSFPGKYIQIIDRLTNVKMRVGNPSMFTFDGGQGLIVGMPLKSAKE